MRYAARFGGVELNKDALRAVPARWAADVELVHRRCLCGVVSDVEIQISQGEVLLIQVGSCLQRWRSGWLAVVSARRAPPLREPDCAVHMCLASG